MNKSFLILCIVFISCGEKKKEPAAQQKTSTAKVLLKQPGFQLEHYSDWTIDSTAGGENMLQLNSPSKNSFASVALFNKGIDEKQYVNDQVKRFVPAIIKDAKVDSFTIGNYTGYGVKIEGYLEFKPIELKIFAGRRDTSSFALMTQLLVSSRATDEPGLQLIQSSFNLNK